MESSWRTVTGMVEVLETETGDIQKGREHLETRRFDWGRGTLRTTLKYHVEEQLDYFLF